MSALPPTWTFRLTRATAFSLVSTGLGTVAHVLAGGCLTLPAVTVGWGAALVAGLWLARRERTLGSILPVLGTVQAVLHLYFCYACEAGTASFGQTLAHLGHHVSCMPAPSLGMIAMHGWAVALAALWLARGEAAVWALARRVRARLAVLLFGTPRLGVPAVRGVRGRGPEVLRPALLGGVPRLRGPPVCPYAAIA